MSSGDNYPPGAANDPNAPYNEVEVPEKNFEVTCSQSLSKAITVTTNNYIPGASGCDYEPDGEGGFSSIGWQDPDDTSDTNWRTAYKESGHKTPLQLIEMLKEYLEKDLSNVDTIAKETNQDRTFLKRKFEHLIEECKDWVEDDLEIC